MDTSTVRGLLICGYWASIDTIQKACDFLEGDKTQLSDWYYPGVDLADVVNSITSEREEVLNFLAELPIDTTDAEARCFLFYQQAIKGEKDKCIYG